MKQKAFILVLCQLCFALIMTQAFAAEVTLAWDPSKSGSVAGYNIYFGTASRTYGAPLDVGNVLSWTVSGLSSKTYYFAVTAYDSMNYESAYSNEVSVAVVSKPVISSMSASIVTSSTATIYWKTDVLSDSQVEYGLTNRYGSSSLLDTGMATSHTRELTGLAASTTYHYRVKSKTAAGGLATSEDATFTTLHDAGDLPAITIVATDPTATEEGPTTGTFTVTRTGSTTSALTVYYSGGGTASIGVDHLSLPGSLTIAAGSSSGTIVITPIDDTLVEGDETVILILKTNAAYTVGSPGNATVTIQDNDSTTTPTVTIAATDPTATEEGPTTGTFTVTRTGSTTSALTVYYSGGGTASIGGDRLSLPGSLTIAAGSSSGTIVITPIDDTLVEGDETVILTLKTNAAYTVGSPGSATVTIIDND